MGSEIRFALKCRAAKQRPRLRRNCSNCVDDKEAFVNNQTDGLSTLDQFNKNRSCLNINQDPDVGNYIPTSLELLSSNSNLFHSSNQIKQPHTITPIRRGAGLYHRNIANSLQAGQFSKDNDNYSQFLPKREYYGNRYHCANKNQDQCAQSCVCEHYTLDHS